MKVFDKDGSRIKTYDKKGNEISVISAIEANNEWCLQYAETIRAEKIAIVEAVTILVMVLVMIFEKKGDKRP